MPHLIPFQIPKGPGGKPDSGVRDYVHKSFWISSWCLLPDTRYIDLRETPDQLTPAWPMRLPACPFAPLDLLFPRVTFRNFAQYRAITSGLKPGRAQPMHMAMGMFMEATLPYPVDFYAGFFN